MSRQTGVAAAATGSHEPPKAPSRLERALALQEFEGELDEWLLDWGFTLSEFLSAKQRIRADLEQQGRIDAQPAPTKPREDERFARVTAECLVIRDFSLPAGVSKEALAKKMPPVVVDGRYAQAIRAIRDVEGKPGCVDIFILKNAPQPATQLAIIDALGELTGAKKRAEKDRRDAEDRAELERRILEEQAAMRGEITLW